MDIRLPCPLPTSWTCLNSYPLSQWCHAIISSSVIPFSSHFQFFPASGSFQISQLFTSGGQSIGASASASVLQWIFMIDFLWMDCFDLAVQGILRSFLQHRSSKASILRHSAFFMVQLSHPYRTTGKTIALTRWTTVDKVNALLFNMLSRFVVAFLPRGKCL